MNGQTTENGVDFMFDLTGKTALVTGSSQGIGMEIAKVLKAAGAEVFVHGKELTSKLKDASKYVGTDKIAVADISQNDVAEKLYSQTGGVDILILNASIQIKKKWYEYTQEEFDYHINCNFKSTYLLLQKYVPYMKEQKWGRIVTLGSVNQYNNHTMLSVYGVTKAAQKKLVENIAPDLAPYNVTINNIAPGAIYTPRNNEALADTEFKAKVENSIPAGYVGETKDIAPSVLYLCSDEGRYMTGAELIIDGGMSL